MDTKEESPVEMRYAPPGACLDSSPILCVLCVSAVHSVCQDRFARRECDVADERQFIKNLPGVTSELPFSRAVVANGFVWVSGIGGGNQEYGPDGGTIEQQTRGTIENLRRVLEAAGSSLDRVVWIQVGLADPDDYARMNAEYVKHFPEDAKPARATVKLGFQNPHTKLVMACTALAGTGEA
jgi:2-iminobutanoate/2-iminopropanoate deaminase